MRSLLAAALIVLLARNPLAADTIALVADDGECVFTLRGHATLVLGSLAGATEKTRVRVVVASVDTAESLPRLRAEASPHWLELIRAQAEAQEKSRRARRVATPDPKTPAKTRTFHLFAKDKDLHLAANYATVTAELADAGVRCQVYLDRDEPLTQELRDTAAEIVRVFDEEIEPWSRRHLGVVHDIDGDGRFTILLSPWLSRLQGGKVALDGFVRGSDFLREAARPFGNQCDMLALNSRLRPGPHLRAVLAHEFAHAVLFCEHMLENHLDTRHKQDEESWLNEGIAHLAEELQGYGWTNLDKRLTAYAQSPEAFPLVVPDYYHSGLWRTDGTRGAAFRFTRWLRQRHGDDVLRRLAQSNLAGIHNVEAATLRPFADTFRDWSVAQMQPGFLDPARGPITANVMKADGPPRDLDLAGTAVAYLRLESAGTLRVRITWDRKHPVQATVVR
jgi:hypothetical protein